MRQGRQLALVEAGLSSLQWKRSVTLEETVRLLKDINSCVDIPARVQRLQEEKVCQHLPLGQDCLYLKQVGASMTLESWHAEMDGGGVRPSGGLHKIGTA